jgi:hypothetical protein
VGLILLKICNINLLFPLKNSVEITEVAKLPTDAEGIWLNWALYCMMTVHLIRYVKAAPITVASRSKA